MKFGNLNKVVFVGKEAVIYGQGCYLVFINVETGKTEILVANSPENGMGIRCYTGHRNIPIFAYAESDCNPNIYIDTYPEFNRICKLAGETEIYENPNLTLARYSRGLFYGLHKSDVYGEFFIDFFG